jgi:hypothetical protein
MIPEMKSGIYCPYKEKKNFDQIENLIMGDKF